MSAEWPIFLLEELCDFQNGFAFKNSDYVDKNADTWEVFRMGYIARGGGFKEDSTPVFVERNYLRNLDRYRLLEGDITIAMTDMKNSMALLGHTAKIPENNRFVLNQRVGCIRVRDTESLYPLYLYYFSNSPEYIEYLRSRANSGVQVNLSTSAIKESLIKVPPMRIQKIIGDTLGSLDDKIQLNHQINQTLEQMAQALFKSWFVDFEPVKAKIAARQRWQALQPENESASPVCYAAEFDEPPAVGDLESYMNRAAMQTIAGKTAVQLDALRAEDPERYDELYETAALFPSAMQASELGEIPEGWDCLSLDQIAKYQNGLALQKFRPENEDNYLPVVKISQLKKGYADGEEKASPNINPECIIDNGDVVFSWSGSLIVDTWCGGRAALNQHLFKVTSTTYPKWLYFHFTRHHLEEFQRIAADKAVTMGHIKREHLKQALCAVPDAKYLSIGKAIDNMFEKQIDMRLESLTLSQMRDTLLPKLLSGELTMPDAEAQMAEVADA